MARLFMKEQALALDEIASPSTAGETDSEY